MLWERGSVIYPVYSRRSGGLSIGINLFPDHKACNFNCPYCEVFPFESTAEFSLYQMEKDLRSSLEYYLKINSETNDPSSQIKDICFSGNGEPTLSVHFPQALEKALLIRDELTPKTPVVLITNATGLLSEKTFNLLAHKANKGLDIWLKIDAGTEEWYKKINYIENMQAGTKSLFSFLPFSPLIESIKKFAAVSPFIIQTMICKINGLYPPEKEEQAWIDLVKDLSVHGKLKAVHIYGKARPSPHDPLAEAVDLTVLENRRKKLAFNNIPVNIYE